MSTNKKIARASAVLICAAACGYALSLVREIVVANYFGIASAMDAYYAALTFPDLIGNVLLSAFGAVFIPVFVRCRLINVEDANRIASAAINLLILLLFLGSLALFAFAPQIIGYCFRGLQAEAAHTAARLLRIVCFTILLTGAIGAMTGILNAFEHFVWPAFSQMLVVGVTILSVILWVQRWGVYSLAFGLCAGLLAQFIVLVPVTRRRGYRHYWRLGSNKPAVRQMLSLALLYLIGIITAQVNIVVDRVMASYLAPGSIAALGYAGKLVHVPIMIFAGSLATAALPFFSAQLARNEVEEMKNTLARSVRMTAAIFIPITVALVMTARLLITILFQRGAFDDDATALTSAILICYSFQLFFYTTALIMGRVFLALQNMAVLVKVAIACAVLNVALNFLFIKLVTPPAAGIALSTSVVYAVAMILCIVYLRRIFAPLRGGYIAKGIAKVAISSAAMACILHAALRLSAGISVCSPLVSGIARLGISLGSACAAFVLVAALLGVDELGAAFRLLRGGTQAGTQ